MGYKGCGHGCISTILLVMPDLRKTLTNQFYRAQINLAPTKPSPDQLWGELFRDVQLQRIYPDSITFADMTPGAAGRRVLKTYLKQRQDPHFNLRTFVQQHFYELLQAPTYRSNPSHTPEQHIEELWGVLRRDIPKNTGSIVGLPYPYVVSGGRFIAQYYWDSYFTMLGLAAGGHWDMVENMVKNCAFLIRKFGYVPNASRTYNSTRSQPPVFALMVQLLATHKPKTTYLKYLPYLLAERAFWMKGSRSLSDRRVAARRVVRMPDGSVLNRYFDTLSTPRPESYKEDVETALHAPGRAPSRVYVDLRAAAESGWDFSSRWFRDPNDLQTIHTTDIVPVDLNCLLVELERTIAVAYKQLKQQRLARRFDDMAERRAAAIRTYCWDNGRKFFCDYDFVAGASTGAISAAGPFALFCRVATPQQAADCARVITHKLLQPGGVVTTLVDNGQQWDWPNGWAPLQWVAIQGLRTYGHHFLADEIKHRWVACNIAAYKKTHKMVEKYNVVEPNTPAGGGEYSLQDGFGWTNGILLALLHEGKA
jgi:alpha,alpha-trehalase